MNPYRSHRLDYEGEGLAEAHAPDAPLEIVEAWLQAAVQRHADAGDVPEPTAMSVATVDADGRPDVRTVLLRSFDRRGPAFFTSTRSTKGVQLGGNPAVAASLTWPSMFRAVRFRGYAELLPPAEVTAYFSQRPWGARIGAHASAQSRPVPDRATLEAAYTAAAQRFPDTGSPDDVPVPEGWGGYRIVVDRVELWAGRPSRLHDRLVWERVAPGDLGEPAAWRRLRLAP